MSVLSQQEMLRIWEVGLGQHPLDRALTMLAAAFPAVPQGQLTGLSIGQRDECLFAVRQKTFGGRLASLIVCPTCQEQLELTLDMADLHIAPDAVPTISGQAAQEMHCDGYELHFRLPNSLDLVALVGYHDVVAARSLLLRRCVLQAHYDGVAVAVEEVPAAVVNALATRMDACDPLAALDIGLACSACGESIHILFDIVTFFWTEISTHAKRLLREVHMLARAYGWREADILSMSAARRQFYLEMVS